ncbi:MAG: MFS transporter [Coxiellaceae bacterium]|nr:MFS transporter [Coxiellaceae bacterium]
MEYRLGVKKPHLLWLILLISFPSVATVLVSPALPAISSFFHISNGYVQQIITLAIIGYALGQLIYSPFANRYGRKIAVYIGLGVYFLSCILCLIGIYTQSMAVILIGRLLMVLGASVGMVITFTVINDFYHPHQARPVVSYAVLAYAFMPALAILVGGFITSHFSWIDCFYFYLVYGFVILIAAWRLPETLINKDMQALKIKKLIRDFVSAFVCWRLMVFSLIYGLMTAFIYVTASGAPFIGIDEIGLSPAVYGLVLLLPYSGQFIGAIGGGQLNKKLTGYKVLTFGYASVIFGSVLMFICFLLGAINVYTLVIPIFFIMMGLPMTYSVSTVMALMNFEDKATGSAVMSFVTMLVSLVATYVLTVLPTKNPLMMPAVYVVLCVLGLVVFCYAWRRYPE